MSCHHGIKEIAAEVARALKWALKYLMHIYLMEFAAGVAEFMLVYWVATFSIQKTSFEYLC